MLNYRLYSAYSYRIFGEHCAHATICSLDFTIAFYVCVAVKCVINNNNNNNTFVCVS